MIYGSMYNFVENNKTIQKSMMGIGVPIDFLRLDNVKLSSRMDISVVTNLDFLSGAGEIQFFMFRCILKGYLLFLKII